MNFIDEVQRIKNNRIFNKIALIGIVLLILLISGFIMLRYMVEGEEDKNMPFVLSKIIVISSAEGTNLGVEDTTWNLNLIQNNDIYISVEKNESCKKNDIIKNIYIENIQLETKPLLGNIQNYRPVEDRLFKNAEQYIITDKLKYIGSTETDIGELKIGNQGGTILFRSSNLNIGNYKSNEDEIVHTGTLLKRANVENEQIKYSIKFDLIIETGKMIKYKGTINMNLPEGNILEDGIVAIEKVDLEDIVFKRM